MQVFPVPFEGDRGKFRGVIQALPHVWKGSVLDVGCRSGGLRGELEGLDAHYWGLDLQPPADVVASLDHGLPFRNDVFDTVVALDVLEHTGDIHGSFREVCRVARRNVVITLPNIHVMEHRLGFLLGHGLGAKYGLPRERPQDRHQWVCSLTEAREFCRLWAQRCDFRVVEEGCLMGRKRRLVGGRVLVGFAASLFCPTYLVCLERVGAGAGRG